MLVPGHISEEHAEVGLVDAELLLNRRRRQTDLPPDDPAPRGERLLRQDLLDGVRGGDVTGGKQVPHGQAWPARVCGFRQSVSGALHRCVVEGRARARSRG
jgi:hypothetical protein